MGKMPNGVMSINLQPVDVFYSCSEGMEGPELAPSPHYACKKGCSDPFTRGNVRICVSFSGK